MSEILKQLWKLIIIIIICATIAGIVVLSYVLPSTNTTIDSFDATVVSSNQYYYPDTKYLAGIEYHFDNNKTIIITWRYNITLSIGQTYHVATLKTHSNEIIYTFSQLNQK